jgi:hypothetical protein
LAGELGRREGREEPGGGDQPHPLPRFPKASGIMVSASIARIASASAATPEAGAVPPQTSET